MHTPLVISLVILAIAVALTVGMIRLVEQFTTKRKLNHQKIILDSACLHAAYAISQVIDDVGNCHGDFVQAMCILFLILVCSTNFMQGWTYPEKESVKE